MAKEIYSEGRVVGYSAYEEVIKQIYSEDPNTTDFPSEREWLSASLASGSSMILKVTTSDSKGQPQYIDYTLPATSNLVTANTIIGSLFLGSCEVDGNNWATKIISYGNTISNTDKSSPTTSTIVTKDTYPIGNIAPLTASEIQQAMQYIKIQEGIVLQPGKWVVSGTTPYKDFTPDFTGKPTIRLEFTSSINTSFYILLTGFTNKYIVKGDTNWDGIGSTGATESQIQSTRSPQNGDFIGPQAYPWANKIEFTYPQCLTYYLEKGLTAATPNIKITHNEDSNITNFYTSKLVPGDGVSVYNPSDTGEVQDIKISSKIGSANNFLKVQQITSTVDNAQTNTLTVSPVKPGSGISIEGPSTAGADVLLKSLIATAGNAANYIKISQKPSTSGEVTTTLNPSTLVSADERYLTVTQPTVEGGNITVTLNIDNITKALKDYVNTAINDIIAKVYGGGSLNVQTGHITWGDGSPIALGNINIQSGADGTHYIATHSGFGSEGDIKVN